MLIFVTKRLFLLKFSQKQDDKLNTREFRLKVENETQGKARKMGLASSQARLLMLTMRKNDIESQLMSVANQKISLSRESSQIAQKFQDSLTATKYVWNVDGSECDLSYSLFNPEKMADSNFALGNALTGAVILGDDLCGTLGISESGTGTEFSSQWNENAFLAKMITGNAGNTAEIVAAKTELEVADSNDNTEPIAHFSTNYDDQDVYTYLEENCTIGTDTDPYYYSSVGAAVVVKYATDDLYEKGISGNPLDICAPYAKPIGDLVAHARTVADVVGGICEDTGESLEAVLKDNFGDEDYAEIEDLIITAQEYAKNMTIAHYAELASGGIKNGIVEGSENLAVNFDGLVNEGDEDGNDEQFLDATQVVKMYLNYFDAACVDLNDNNSIDESANTSAYTNRIDDVTFTQTTSSVPVTSNGYTYYVSVPTYSYSAGSDVTRGSSGGIGKTCTTGVEEKAYSGNKSITNTKLYYYQALFEELATYGWETFAATGDLSEKETLQNKIANGDYVLLSYYESYTSWEYISAESSTSPLSEIDDSEKIAEAEAEYDAEKAKIEYKEEILDLNSNRLDTERSEVTTEVDSVKNILKDHYEDLKMFANG